MPFNFTQPRTEKPSYTVGQTWGALKKAWRGYKIAKVQDDKEKMKEYALKIRKFQRELGVKQVEFPELDIS